MDTLAINKQSADALTELADKLRSTSSNVRHETDDLKSNFNRETEALGEFADDAENMIKKAEQAVDVYQEAIDPIPNKLNEVSLKIIKILQNRMGI